MATERLNNAKFGKGLALTILDKIDKWRVNRNQSLHEMVKIEKGTKLTWEERSVRNKKIVVDGYRVLVEIYQRVAALNRRHSKYVFSENDSTELDKDVVL